MYWIQIGEDYFDLAGVWRVHDHRILTEEEMKRPERDSFGTLRPRPSVTVHWKHGSTESFRDREADEFMAHFDKFKSAQADPAGRGARD